MSRAFLLIVCSLAVASFAEAKPRPRAKIVKVSPKKPAAEAKTPSGVPIIALVVGGKQQVAIPKLTRLSMADPRIADLNHLGGDKIEVHAVRPGTTELRAWLQDGGQRSWVVRVAVPPK